MGCVYVLALTDASGKVGAGTFTGLTVTSVIITSILLDHYGLLGFEQHYASVPRLFGAALMIVGIVLISRY